ncbi:MAG TPA: DUF3105 domain-containing protein [Thermopolyspora sp.]|jgi:Protein of unknown function (DUF3105).
MTKEKTQARRERLAKMRAEARRKERRSAMLMWGVGGLVIVVLLGVVGFYLVRENTQASLDNVRTYAYVGAQHKDSKVTYKESPPVGGEHNSVWQNCGVYDQPINSENAVHSMEHGAVWITYRPDLPKGDVDSLRKLVTSDYMLLSPYPGLPAPVVVSSWNHQLVLKGASDPRLPKYIAKYKENPSYTPELGASCKQGTDATAAQNPIPDVAPSPAASTMPGEGAK